eukprot:4411841-Amphidinium_carterae.1
MGGPLSGLLRAARVSLTPRHEPTSSTPPGLARVPTNSMSELSQRTQRPAFLIESMLPLRWSGRPAASTLDPPIPWRVSVLHLRRFEDPWRPVQPRKAQSPQNVARPAVRSLRNKACDSPFTSA